MLLAVINLRQVLDWRHAECSTSRFSSLLLLTLILAAVYQREARLSFIMTLACGSEPLIVMEQGFKIKAILFPPLGIGREGKLSFKRCDDGSIILFAIQNVSLQTNSSCET